MRRKTSKNFFKTWREIDTGLVSAIRWNVADRFSIISENVTSRKEK